MHTHTSSVTQYSEYQQLLFTPEVSFKWTSTVHMMAGMHKLYMCYLVRRCYSRMQCIIILLRTSSVWKLLDLYHSKQGNTTNLNISFSMENEKKKSCSGGIQTHDILLTRQMLYQLSYRGSSAGWVESRQYKARATSLTHDILLTKQMLYQLRYRGSSAGWAESSQYKARATSLTHDILLTRQMLYQLSYRGSSAGWAVSSQYKARATSLTHDILLTRQMLYQLSY